MTPSPSPYSTIVYSSDMGHTTWLTWGGGNLKEAIDRKSGGSIQQICAATEKARTGEFLTTVV